MMYCGDIPATPCTALQMAFVVALSRSAKAKKAVETSQRSYKMKRRRPSSMLSVTL